jgi:NAD(P)-dependent dehydrogenase (short-subunit alcohol dehydrogenase family)
MSATLVLIIIAFLMLLLRVLLRFGVLIYESNESMTGKVVIVTGANSGIGYHTAKELARRGARVILACRNKARGTAARDQIVAEIGGGNVFYQNLDLASLASVRSFCQHILATETRLDVLVNNAGVFGFGDRYTEDGIVEGMQINYFGLFLLTELLLPLLKKSTPSRIVNVSSLLQYIGNFKVNYVNQKGYYTDLMNYSNSKMCSMAYTVELAERLKGSGVVVNAVHPGVIKTQISDNASKMKVSNFFTYVAWRLLCWVCYRTVWEGAQPILQVCVDPALAHVSGKFFVDGAQWPYSWHCSNKMVRLNLWQTSEKFCNKTS